MSEGREAIAERTITTRDSVVGPDGARRFVREWIPQGVTAGSVGEPAPVLLFHESLGCVALWKGFPLALAKATGRRVIAYDRVGHGRSDPRRAPQPPDFIAREGVETLPLLRRGLGFTRFVACGHSVGGGMAVETAARMSDDCVGLVTIAAQSFVETRTSESVRAAEPLFLAPDRIARLARHHGDKARSVVLAWTGVWPDPAFADWSLDAARDKVVCPVLAVHGEADDYGSPAHARRIAGRTGELLLMEGAGHMLHREREAELVAAIAEFLTRVER